MNKHCYTDLIRIFNDLFRESYQTELMKGEGEPIYLPKSDDNSLHRIVFANGFFSSALHEISHWCIAGEKRRQLVDFGYWYQPDGRDVAQQKAFEQVEVKPQALEWIFTVAADKNFVISADNLNGDRDDSSTFKQNVVDQVHEYLEHGLPERTQQFLNALTSFYKTNDKFSPKTFTRSALEM